MEYRPTNPKRGHRLGTFSATWNKIKAATFESSESAENGASADSAKGKTPDQNGSSATNDANGSSEKSETKKPSKIVEFGPRGEMCVYYPDQGLLELWDWVSPEGSTYRGDSLNLVRSLQLDGRKYNALKVGEFFGQSVIVSTCSKYLFLHHQVGKECSRRYIELPACFEGPYSIKLSSKFITVASSKGYVALFKVAPDLKFATFQSHSLHQNITRPIASRDGITIEEEFVVLKTSVCDKTPIYDIQGSWLAYCPTKCEMDHQKHLLHSNSNSTKKKNSHQKCSFTELKLPPSGPLLMRVVSSISGSALDKLYALSESGSKTFREYWSKPKGSKGNFMDKDVSLHSISTNISQALYSTANKIKNSALDSGEHKYIRIINLDSSQIIATFKPPAGVSNLSLSPYDLQLVQASHKGDNFYLWDLYRLPNEASLVGKFSRGNTSATVREIFWFVNTEEQGSANGTNSGFGCISKKKGSLHWYNINYLSCGNDANNYPNKLGGSSGRKGLSNDQFLDSWVLPSIGAVSFVKLPKVSNLPSSSDDTTNDDKKLLKMDQLAFIDKRDHIRLVSPLNGKHTFKYVLPKEGGPPTFSSSSKEGTNYLSYLLPLPRASQVISEDNDSETPLAQTEIETCNQYLSIINDKRFELATYELDEEADVFDYLADFGSDIPTKRVDFRGNVDEQSPLVSGELSPDLDNGLVINPETSAEES
ncbi:hypothetical protein FT663_01224 [Candidozyma haemuli var. vulneris]|nr:hypothetical protein FT662_01274 [[Candida] haemuloni var. vulneris]KAF3994646.1 hypothetical protein FT663_01224 [[Candida] haemuloni var. vulneris]